MLGLLIAAAFAQEAPAGEPYTDPFATVLDSAKKAWFEGRASEAQALFEVLSRRLTFGEHPGAELEADALIYLGEVYQSQGRFDDAAAAFRGVVERNPEAVINPYHHPPEVVAQFNSVRELVLIELSTRHDPEPVVEPAPAWTLLPLGAGQFGQGQVGRGTLYGTLQVSLGVVSVAALVSLRNMNGTFGDPVQWDPAAYPNDPGYLSARLRGIQTLRYGVQWPATFGFYGVWALSVIDARVHWHAEQVREPTVLVLPRQGGADLRVQFLF